MQFLPLDNLRSASAKCKAALESAHTYVELLKAGGADSSTADSVLARTTNAIDGYAADRPWAEFTASLISHIFRTARISNISTGLYGPLKKTREWHEGLAATLRELAISARESDGLIADRGGALLIEHQGITQEYREIATEPNSSLVLRGRRAPDLELTESAISQVAICDVKGPVEVQVLSKLGALPHLPWYCRWRTVTNAQEHHQEWIRPIVVADPARTPAVCRGALEPSGYSLVDYLGSTDTPLLLGSAGVTEHQLPALLRELTSIAKCLPAIRQKAQKSQSGIRAFRAKEESEWIASLRKGHSRYTGNPQTRTAGDELLYMIAALACLRSRLSEGPSSLPSAGSHLELQGITSSTQLNTGKVIDGCRKSLLNGIDFLRSRGQGEQSLDEVIERFNRGCQELEKMDGVNFGGITGNALRDSGIGWMISGLRNVADAYFAWQLFLLATLLKASIWPMYLLWGEDLPGTVDRMLTQRNQPSLAYQPLVWS